jgi:hypothetical protein
MQVEVRQVLNPWLSDSEVCSCGAYLCLDLCALVSAVMWNTGIFPSGTLIDISEIGFCSLVV